MLIKSLLSVFIIACLSACSSLVDEHYHAAGQSSRVRYIVLHYTGSDKESSFRQLTRGRVSAHYLITDDKPAKVLQLVDENRKAWHAGYSQWHDDTDLNVSSIGIEIVNQGPLSTVEWQPFTESQIQRLIAILKDIQQRHRIRPENILGHSDIAPLRKIDPGPVFPWQRLAKEGIGTWYDAERVLQAQQYYQQQGLPSIVIIQQKLKKLGYAVEETGNWDAQSQKVLRAFQMHYRPTNYDGQPDAQTMAILDDLLRGR